MSLHWVKLFQNPCDLPHAILRTSFIKEVIQRTDLLKGQDNFLKILKPSRHGKVPILYTVLALLSLHVLLLIWNSDNAFLRHLLISPVDVDGFWQFAWQWVNFSSISQDWRLLCEVDWQSDQTWQYYWCIEKLHSCEKYMDIINCVASFWQL